MEICNFVCFDFSFLPVIENLQIRFIFLFDRDLEPVVLRRLLKFYRTSPVISLITAICNTIKWKIPIFDYSSIHNGLTVNFLFVITSE